MLPMGRHVTGAYGGEGGLLAAAKPGSLFIDCSTVDIDSATAAHNAAAAAGMLSVDAPVSGGVGGATAGTLTFMVGGDDAAAKRRSPSSRRWARRSCIAAAPGPVRRRKSATT